MNGTIGLCLSPGPLFVTRRGNKIILFHGGLQRWHSARIATFEVRWRSNWKVKFRGEGFDLPVNGSLVGEASTFLAFKGVVGQMQFVQGEIANLRIWRKEPGSYSIQAIGPKEHWQVELAGGRTRDRDVKVVISCNGRPVVSAPSRYETWTEGFFSVGGFVRHKWGDWLVQGNQPLPAPAAVACLLCAALHNSVVGDLLVSDNAIG